MPPPDVAPQNSHVCLLLLRAGGRLRGMPMDPGALLANLVPASAAAPLQVAADAVCACGQFG